jgi:hypothetical protein
VKSIYDIYKDLPCAAYSFSAFSGGAFKPHEDGGRVEDFVIDKPLHPLDSISIPASILFSDVLRLPYPRHQLKEFVVVVNVDKLISFPPAELLLGLEHSHIIY